jgi:predicted nucleotidyltransferase
MMHIEKYVLQLIEKLESQFSQRLIYVGLQGSYLRGEATEDSDIDIMVVIDGLRVDDLAAYRNIVNELPYADKSCGFICSKTDLLNWNPLEICHLVNTTKDCYGELKTIVPSYTQMDVCNYVKMSLNNLYHGICHRYIHGKKFYTVEELAGVYKGVFFILQDMYYLQTGKFVATKKDLLNLLSGRNRKVLERAIELNQGVSHNAEASFELLFHWCQDTLAEIG